MPVTNKAVRELAFASYANLMRLTSPDEAPDILQSLKSMGPSCFLDDLTEDELVGAVKFMDYLTQSVQFARGQKHTV
jgi:hypothetical protein